MLILSCSKRLLFIKKEFRGSRAGLRLIKETEIHATSLGCKLMLWHAKENTTLAAILPRLKYGVQDIIYSRSYEMAVAAVVGAVGAAGIYVANKSANEQNERKTEHYKNKGS